MISTTASSHKSVSPTEELGEFAIDTAKKIIPTVLEAFNPFAGMFEGLKTPTVEKDGTKKHTPLDFQKLQKAYAAQDEPQVEAIKAQLGIEQGNDSLHGGSDKLRRHRQFQNEQMEYIQQQKQHEQSAAQQEAQMKVSEEERLKKVQHAQSNSTPHGKIRRNILGGGHHKASTDLPPEFRAESKPGGGKN